MSRLFVRGDLTPYVPGEQPAPGQQWIKLNTNENPFPPSPAAKACAAAHLRELNLYSSVDCLELRTRLAEVLGVGAGNLVMTNGSDEILNFAFMAFCDSSRPAVFPDITYGFYSVFADLNRIPWTTLPLREDFTVNPEDYCGIGKNIFIANPNAPTGIALSRAELERIIASNPDHLVLVDEAYCDFGGESCIPLIGKYDNLLVTGTFSKSRSLAGGRLGFGVACEELIRDLENIRYSTNPYNVNSLTIAIGLGVLEDEETTRERIRTVISTREKVKDALEKRGFHVLPSSANFLFAEHPQISGEAYFRRLKERGILIRHFTAPRIANFNRITVGTEAQMEIFLSETDRILKGEG